MIDAKATEKYDDSVIVADADAVTANLLDLPLLQRAHLRSALHEAESAF